MDTYLNGNLPIDQTMMKREWVNTLPKIYSVYNCQLNKLEKATIPVKGV